MDSGYLTGKVRIGIPQCSCTSTICLRGFHCWHSGSSERHPFYSLSWSTRWNSRCISASVAQFAWDGIVTQIVAVELLDRATTSMDEARLLAAGAAHAGDWTRLVYLLPVLVMQETGQGVFIYCRCYSCRRMIAGTFDHSSRSYTRKRDNQSSRGTSTGREHLWASHRRLWLERQRKMTSWVGMPKERRTLATICAAQRYHLKSRPNSWCTCNQGWTIMCGRKEARGM